MLFPNPAKALTEMRRVVKPGGKVAVMVYAALEKNLFWGIFHKTVRRLGNIPPPAPGEPWMFALGEPGALEEVYRRGDFLNVSVCAVPIQRRIASAAAAVENMRKGAGDTRELMNRLNEADRERAWATSQNSLDGMRGRNGFEIPGEVLVGVGTKYLSEETRNQ
jgi:hypothetical protein